MLLSRTVRASWSIAAVLLLATLDNTAANEGAFQHLRALQDIASGSGGNRAAGTTGYDRSAEYVAERLKEAGYVVRLEKFEFPFFEERASPVLVTSTPGGAQMPASAGVVRTLVRTACWRDLASTIMVAARPRCSKRRCDWCGSRPEHAVASEKGIPTVGLYAGASGLKSESQAGVFGGVAGRPYDPCYHRACDTIDNVNREVWEQNTRALLRALDALVSEIP